MGFRQKTLALNKSSRICEGQRYRLNIEVYFAHAHSTQERTKMKAGSPTVFPKRMDFFKLGANELAANVAKLNARPEKCVT